MSNLDVDVEAVFDCCAKMGFKLEIEREGERQRGLILVRQLQCCLSERLQKD